MASLILLFSEIVRNPELDAANLLAAYPSSSCAAVAGKSVRNLKQKSKMSEEKEVMENPLESRLKKI
ncbi:uncharacterized protein G2W53_040558 [Senna tora]|uniref:Uncharacterized protein n=1 Tax=Senna tora TaxID=362788 RepID=A0A834SDM8_9FABA|nr:uncharacterized protein G2W53_040558 [Senna tora]